MGAAAPLAGGDWLHARAQALEDLFRDVMMPRLRGLPLLHPGLDVRAVGFEPDADGTGALGVLVTPWFMNLVWLPRPGADAAVPLAVGAKRLRSVGPDEIEFIGAIEPGFGAFEACSLFSPMQEFVDQAAALATADELLRILRRAVPDGDKAVATSEPAGPAAAAVPSRRALLFGRGPGATR